MSKIREKEEKPLEPEFHRVSHQQQLDLLCLLLLLSILSICSSLFVVNKQTNVLVAVNADTGQLPQFASVATTSFKILERAPNQPTDDRSKDNYFAVLKRLGQDEYRLPESVVN